MEMSVHHGDELPLERRMTYAHLIEHEPERVDVGPAVYISALYLLGRHVERSTCYCSRASRIWIQCLRDAEIGQRRRVASVDHDVRRLDIQVDNFAQVSVV